MPCPWIRFKRVLHRCAVIAPLVALGACAPDVEATWSGTCVVKDTEPQKFERDLAVELDVSSQTGRSFNGDATVGFGGYVFEGTFTGTLKGKKVSIDASIQDELDTGSEQTYKAKLSLDGEVVDNVMQGDCTWAWYDQKHSGKFSLQR